VLIELVSLDVTAYRRYERILIVNQRFEGGGSFSAKFLGRRGRPSTILARIDRSMIALQHCR